MGLIPMTQLPDGAGWETVVSIIASCSCHKDNSIDEVQMTVLTFQYVVWHSIKNVVTPLQDVVPARALISSRTPRANADALSNRQRSLSFRHSPTCGSRSVWFPFILRFYFWWQRYERFLKEGRKMRKSLQDCQILAIFAPVNVIYSLKY